MLKKYLHIFYDYFPIIALLFGAIYLINLDIGKIKLNIGLFILSLVVLFCLFLFRAFIWYVFLKKVDPQIDYRVCIVSRFRFILAKYIPGKFWHYIGSGAVQEKYTNQSFANGTFNAVAFQILNNIAGFIVGGAGLVLLINPDQKTVFLPAIVLICIMAMFFFSKERKVLPGLQRFFSKKEYRLTGYKIPDCRYIFILLLAQWILLGCSYFLLFKSANLNLPFHIVLLQPLANNIGMVSVFAPGGIGVREGFMVFYLNQLGLTLETASMIAILSRFWFIIVEFFAFFVGFFVEKRMQGELLSGNIEQ